MEGSRRWRKDFEVGKEGRRSSGGRGGKVKLDGVVRILLYESASAHFVLQSSPKVNCNELQH